MNLIFEQVSKSFGKFQAINNLSLAMDCGVYGLLGVNGAGKTTLMRILSTVMRPTSGTITYQGKDIFQMGAEYRNVIGYLPQDFGYYPDLKVRDYLLYIASIKGLKTPTAKKRADALLELVGLTGKQKTKMRNLSGGMKRRVGIAQAMLNDPEILILDEPTAGLDPKETIRFRNLIGELAENRIVLLSTHVVADVEAIANEVFFMKDGQIVKSGSVEAICAGMESKAWICRVSRNEAAQLMGRNQIVNMHREGGETILRVLAKEMPIAGARRDHVTLEDVFLHDFGEQEEMLYYFGEQEEEPHAEL